MEIQKVDITPSWETCFRIYIDVIERGKPKAKKEAWESFKSETMRLAKEVDKLQAKQKKSI